MTDDKTTSYSSIFKTTFLFGFVQVFNIAVRVVLNKIVAVLLGAEGLGIIGIYNSVIAMLRNGAGLGISQSAVRDIAEANKKNDAPQFSRIISLTNHVIIWTSVLGIALTIILSPFLSRWSFGSNEYTTAFIWLSLVVGVGILSEGQLAILKGMRQLRALAKSSMLGSVSGVIAAIPFYSLYGKNGIIPSLFITAFASLFFSNYFVRKIKYDKIRFSVASMLKEASPMIRMGIALMLVGFISNVFDVVVVSFINRSGNLADAGFYNAGAAIITGYFGIIITAMSTDYYPRISAVHSDNVLLQEEMNKQSETGLIMIFPAVVLFVFLSPIFVRILYSTEFHVSSGYVDYAMFGVVITVVSNCMGLILLAKQASNIFIWSVLGQRIVLLIVYLTGYKFLGIAGLGISYIITSVLHISLMSILLGYFYHIKLSKRIYKLLGLVLLSTLLVWFIRRIDVNMLKYALGSVFFLLASLFSIIYMKTRINIDLIKILKHKLTHKKR